MKYNIRIRFIKTFTKNQLKDIKDYYKVMELYNKGCPRKIIRKKVKVSMDKLHLWRNTKTKPNSVKILQEAEKRKYLQMPQKANLEWLAYLIGYNLGDGNISKKLNNVWFYGVDNDLEDIRKLLIKFGIKPVIYTYKIDNGKMAVHDRVFSRFLICFGAVVGDKTKSRFYIPNWILNSNNKQIKKRFLQGLCDSELSSIKKIKNKNHSYQSLKFYQVKEKAYVNNGIKYMNQIRRLFKECRVSTSKIYEDRTYFRGRDGSTMKQLFFILYSNSVNLNNFIENIGFLNHAQRRQDLMKIKKEIKERSDFEKEKLKKYYLALNLRKKGLSAYKIAKKLNIEVFHIKNWIYFKKKPRILNFNII